MPRNASHGPWGDRETIMWTIENASQLAWMRARWNFGFTQWRVGYTQAMDGMYMNLMRRELGTAFGAAYVRAPLARWWEPEEANLPLDISPPM